ncbi:hypothetical protein D3C86_2205900 [compost metagenome]
MSEGTISPTCPIRKATLTGIGSGAGSVALIFIEVRASRRIAIVITLPYLKIVIVYACSVTEEWTKEIVIIFHLIV